MTEDAAQTYTFKNAVLATGSTPIEIRDSNTLNVLSTLQVL